MYTVNGSICMVNAAGKIASALATRKKGGARKRERERERERERKRERSATLAGVARRKKGTTHRVLCRTRPMAARRKAKKRSDGLHKNTGYEMQNQHTLVRGPCFAYASGKSIRSGRQRTDTKPLHPPDSPFDSFRPLTLDRFFPGSFRFLQRRIARSAITPIEKKKKSKAGSIPASYRFPACI